MSTGSHRLWAGSQAPLGRPHAHKGGGGWPGPVPGPAPGPTRWGQHPRCPLPQPQSRRGILHFSMSPPLRVTCHLCFGASTSWWDRCRSHTANPSVPRGPLIPPHPLPCPSTVTCHPVLSPPPPPAMTQPCSSPSSVPKSKVVLCHLQTLPPASPNSGFPPGPSAPRPLPCPSVLAPTPLPK